MHYQRFGEALRLAQEKMNSKNFYAFNPEFDVKQRKAATAQKNRAGK